MAAEAVTGSESNGAAAAVAAGVMLSMLGSSNTAAPVEVATAGPTSLFDFDSGKVAAAGVTGMVVGVAAAAAAAAAAADDDAEVGTVMDGRASATPTRRGSIKVPSKAQ